MNSGNRPISGLDIEGLDRRSFLARTGLAIGAGILSPSIPVAFTRAIANQQGPLSWSDIRAQFNLDPGLIHMACFYLVSHPGPVREAIEKHRKGLDNNPFEAEFWNSDKFELDVRTAAAQHLGVNADNIALTDSTTMGLGLLYGGLTLREGEEILSTTHDHYSTEMSLKHRAARTGASYRQVPLYQKPESTTVDEIVGSIVKNIRPNTRIVAVTWVHSGTGVKIPLKQMSEAIAKINTGRSEETRIIFCVDGVHGLGVEDVTMEDLGCDFFVAGCHKWIFGPRGTGIVYGRPTAWPVANRIIPTFDGQAYEQWMGLVPVATRPPGPVMSPGGFHSFEHRWALADAFRYHMGIGKARIAQRVHELNRRLKEGLASIKHVKLHTPMSDDLSAGIVCFEVEGMDPIDVVKNLRTKNIVATVTPYKTLYDRLAPSIVNTPEQVDATVKAVEGLKG